MVNRSVLQIFSILLLGISPVMGAVEMARSAEVSPQDNPAVAINTVERLMVLYREGAISKSNVINSIDRLAQTNDHPTFTAFLIRLLEHQDSDIRGSAASGLGSMRKSAKSVIPKLIPLLKDPNPSVRRGAASGLGRIGEAAQSAIPKLIPLLEDPDRSVRCNAAQTLGFVGKPATVALRPLIRLLKDPSPEVRDCTAFALGKLEPFLNDDR